MGQHETEDVAKISRKGKNRNKFAKQENKRVEVIACQYCDRKYPKQKELCPAYGKICGKCGKPNHFATVCRSYRDPEKRRQRKDSRQTYMKRNRDIRRTITESETDDSESDIDEESNFLEESVRHLTI